MQKEVRSGKVKITVTVAESLRNKFNKLCKKQGTSAAQRVRDFMQGEVKVAKALP